MDKSAIFFLMWYSSDDFGVLQKRIMVFIGAFIFFQISEMLDQSGLPGLRNN